MAMKAQPEVPDFVMEEGKPLLAVVAEAPATARTWKRHLLNPFGDCSLHDWGWCCVAQWVPCVSYGRNMRRGLKLSYFAQALLFLALFGGIGRIVDTTVEHECPLFDVNPAYVKLHGMPDFPPPSPAFAFAEHHHHHHHHGDDTEHAAAPKTTNTVPMASMTKATETKPAKPVHVTEVDVEVVVPKATVDKVKANLLSKLMSVKSFEGKAFQMFHDEVAKKDERRGLKEGEKGDDDHHKEGEKGGDDDHHHHHHKQDVYHPADGVNPYVLNKGCAKWHMLSLIGVLCSLIGAVYAGARRTQMRERFGIAGSPLGDFMAWLCCPLCANAQESRTLSHHSVEDGEWPEPQEDATIVFAPAVMVVAP